MSQIHFTSGGHKLAGNLFTAGSPKDLAFLFIQGWAGHQNIEAAQALAALGFTSLTYDMRGNRDSEGDLARFSRTEFVHDAVTAYDYLKQRVNPKAIGVVGGSFGAYTAVLASAERPVRCLALRVPASYPDAGFDEPLMPKIASDELTVWRKTPLDYTQNRAFAALHNFAGNVQIVEAAHDELVPHQAVENYANAVSDKARLEQHVMRDAPHSLTSDRLRTEYTRLLTEWAARQLG